MPLLDKIESPRDLKNLDLAQLKQLAEEIRKEVIGTVAKVGGHLAPTLGVVELTLALHKVFEAPDDQIIWDVGHQAYAHKLLTGRRKIFHTLRQYGGVSGFPRISESPYDAFGTAHAGTSISAALGMAVARDMRGGKERVVAVIGDAGISNGMAFEAMNNAGTRKTDLLVILNDNRMSIAPNVGGLSAYLTKLVTSTPWRQLHQDVEYVLRQVPRVGDRLVSAAKRLEENVKGLIVPGILFEEIGFRYIGPIDGHNLESLTETLESVKKIKGPVLLHVYTTKGKGYTPAEKDAVTFHGCGPFNEETGELLAAPGGKLTYTKAFGQALTQLAEQDDRVIGITAAMPAGTGVEILQKKFPQRAFDVGIAEEHAVTFAGGLARRGMRPVVAIYSTFLQRGYDQIIHDIVVQGLPVVFALDRAGLVGDDGPTHHGCYDISYLRCLPGMTVMAPADENELGHMLKTALSLNGPVAIRYPRGAGRGVSVDETKQALEVGKAALVRPGKDVALVALGPVLEIAEAAAVQLATEGIDAAVVNARFAKPLDSELLLRLARTTRGFVTIEDAALPGGFGAGVLELLAENGLGQVPVTRIGIPDQIVDHGAIPLLRKSIGMTPDAMVAAAKPIVVGVLPARMETPVRA